MEKCADIILKGKNIFCGKGQILRDGFVAVKGQRIIAAEETDLMGNYVGENTEIMNFGNKTIMPGFHDCHVHVIDGGLFSNGLQLGESRTEEEAAQMVKDYADRNPRLPWIIGYGWYHIYWESKEFPTKETLDAVINDRPVFLQNEDGHGAWVNSKALEICGVNKDTPDPEFGTVFKDEKGEPTGYLDELAMMLCAHKAYVLPDDYEKSLLKDFMKEANRKGVTSVNDMRPLFDMDLGNLKNYEELDEKGQQSVRINFSTNLFGSLEEAAGFREKYRGGKLHYAGLKQFIDGVAIPYTAVLLEDYADKQGWKGEPIVDVKKLEAAVAAANDRGIPVHLHAAGDGSVRIALDAYEKAQKTTDVKNVRHSVEHIDNIHPDDLLRFEKLGVVASMQPEHMAPTENFEDNPYVERLGRERSKLTWAIGSLLRNGAHVAFGTDYPVVDINPMNGIYRAVTRRHDDGKPEKGWNEDERITVEQALHNYTYGSAYMVGRENELGTLAPGKLADIVVLDRNIFETETEEIRDISVEMTLCDGNIVYRKG